MLKPGQAGPVWLPQLIFCWTVDSFNHADDKPSLLVSPPQPPLITGLLISSNEGRAVFALLMGSVQPSSVLSQQKLHQCFLLLQRIVEFNINEGRNV